jgi:hypothetical protein
MLFSLIFNRPTKAAFEVIRNSGSGAGKSVIEFDASLAETHTRSAEVSQNEIEDGSNVSDNVRLKPRKLQIKGLISDAPIGLLGSAVGLGVASASQLASKAASNKALGTILGTAAGTAVGSVAGIITGSPRDPKKVWRALDEIYEAREPFTVVTALQRYENMVITELSAPRSSTVGKGLEFDVTLEQVRIVQSSAIKVAVFKSGVNGAATQAKLGKQAGKEAENSSILFRLAGFKKG